VTASLSRSESTPSTTSRGVAQSVALHLTGRARAPRRCNKFASPSGSDEASGRARASYRTVQRLVDRLAPGQTGCLLKGVFDEDINIARGGASGARLTLTTAPGARAVFCGSIEVRDSANYVTIARLRIDGSCNSGENTLQIWGDSVTVRGNDVTNRRRALSCIFIGHHDFGLAYGTVVDRNRIHQCGRDTRYDHGIYAAASRNLRITNNYIYDSGGWGIQLYQDAQGTLIERNVVDGSIESGLVIAGDDSYASSHAEVALNIFTRNRRHGVDESWGSLVGTKNFVEHNCFWGNKSGDFDKDFRGYVQRKNIHANPRYVDPLHGNFRLKPKSPCRGLGPRWRLRTGSH
jgi:parallel beta-helix repeat protein